MKPSLVVDCPVVMVWLFVDGQDACAEAVLDRLRSNAALIPSLCHLETANVLLLAERKKRISRAQTERILSLGREYGLTAYDAAYLELAVRANLPLATLDSKLRKAAKAAGLPELPA